MTATKKSKRGRKRKEPEAMRHSILDSMVQLVSENGYEQTNLQEVADHVGIAKGTLYLYFQNKEDLFRESVQYAIDQLAVRIDTEVQKQSTPLLKLRAVVHAYLQFIDQQQLLTRVILHEATQFQTHAEVSYFNLCRRNTHNLSDILEEGMDSGIFRRQEPGHLANNILFLLTGAMYASIHEANESSPSENARRIVEFVLHGILAKSPQVENGDNA